MRHDVWRTALLFAAAFSCAPSEISVNVNPRQREAHNTLADLSSVALPRSHAKHEAKIHYFSYWLALKTGRRAVARAFVSRTECPIISVLAERLLVPVEFDNICLPLRHM
jgi:hypothetical protein